MSTLTKSDLIAKVNLLLKVERDEADMLVNAFFEEIRSALEHGENVKISGFGNFSVLQKPQRPGRNPKTGEEIPIMPRKIAHFRSGQKLKQRVSNSKPKKYGKV